MNIFCWEKWEVALLVGAVAIALTGGILCAKVDAMDRECRAGISEEQKCVETSVSIEVDEEGVWEVTTERRRIYTPVVNE